MLGPIVLALVFTHALTASLPAAVQEPTKAPWPPTGVYRPGGEVTSPRMIKDVRPFYTPDALRARIRGSVLLEAVVQPDGKVGEVRVKRSLDRTHGLDNEAVKSMKQWQFTPGTKDGVAVPVLVEVEMTFTTK